MHKSSYLGQKVRAVVDPVIHANKEHVKEPGQEKLCELNAHVE